LQRTIAPLIASSGLGTAVSMQVVDVATGASLFSMNPDAQLVPASTAKLLTGAAVLTAVGPTTTLRTQVVDGMTREEVVLVGGGDMLLGAGRSDPDSVVGRAGLADLADATAAALKANGRTSVAVRLDDSLFRGPATSPVWRPGDVRAGYVAPVMALEVDAGRVPHRVARMADPAMSAGRTFAALLGARGITVTAPVVRASAPKSATVLAGVESAPIADLVEYALTESDNTVAEGLARVVALRLGRPATFTDAGRAVLDQVALLGVPTSGNMLVDGSGLGSGSLVSARTLTSLLALAGSVARPELRPVLTGLPVAGASGTLRDRFEVGSQQDGLGVVRAKTGSLQGVNALAGTVVDADGRLLAFTILADRTGSTEPARNALDAIAVALTRCGCR
jgi:D-alanyl-D-alanine carboxypeptidase/D-alanyl-D-alanine-endopeptidase (penicillin-binding protein 4)